MKKAGLFSLFVLLMCLPLLAGNGMSAKEAVNHPDRFEGDAQHDARRKPVEFLKFSGIGEGMVVLDFFAGGGYYTELLSRMVGPNGKVYAHNNQAYLNFVKKQYEPRLEGNRLPNVKRVDAEANDLDFPKGELDAVFMALAWHDTYYADEQNGWPAIDGDGLLKKLYGWLKPGGIIMLSDNSAEAGSGDRDAQSLHRIDEAFLIKQFEKAGFVVDQTSDLLRHPDDSREKLVFDQSIYGKHDRFIVRFRKPR